MYRVFVGKHERKRQVQMGEHITMNNQEPGCEDGNGLHLAQVMDKWQAIVKTVMNFQVL